MAEIIVTSASGALTDPEDASRLTLRGALERAAETPEADRITFAEDVTRIEWNAPYRFSGANTENITIDGDFDDDRQPDVTLSMGDTTNHFYVYAGADVTLNGLTLADGRTVAGSAGQDVSASIANLGKLTLTDVDFTGNAAFGGTGATGSTGAAGTTPGKASKGYNGSPGDDGDRGGLGGTGGDAATVTNLGPSAHLTLDNVTFDATNQAVPGNGGRGGTGGKGSTGGEGGGFQLPTWSNPLGIEAGKGGRGGDGGDGGYQGRHGTGAHGVRNDGGTVEGILIAATEAVNHGYSNALREAFGGAAGSGGRGGVSSVGFRRGSGDDGSSGDSTWSTAVNRTSQAIQGIGDSVEVVDAYFTVLTLEGPFAEGDEVTFGIQRHSMDVDRGAYSVNWALDLDLLVTEDDFIGATSGQVSFSALSNSDPTAGSNIATVTLRIAADSVLEGAESVAIRLTEAQALSGDARVVKVAPEAGRFTIASQLPTEGDDDLRGTADDDTFLMKGGDDVVRGLGGKDLLKGEAGDDKLLGGGKADRLLGGNGSDTVKGGAGADTVKGGGGNDRVLGGDGGDLLEAGRGTDTLGGGRGADVFVFAPREGRNVIVDFEDGVDKIDLLGAGRFKDLDITQVGGATKIAYEGTVIRLRDFDESDLSGADFI